MQVTRIKNIDINTTLNLQKNYKTTIDCKCNKLKLNNYSEKYINFLKSNIIKRDRLIG